MYSPLNWQRKTDCEQFVAGKVLSSITTNISLRETIMLRHQAEFGWVAVPSEPENVAGSLPSHPEKPLNFIVKGRSVALP